MNRNTIKWRIFKYNIIIIVVLIVLTTLVFNIAIRLYIERDVTKQLDNISVRAEDTALHKGPDFFAPINDKDMPRPPEIQSTSSGDKNDLFRFYFILDRSLREPLSMLNADYVLFDSGKNLITSPDGDYFRPSNEVIEVISNEVRKLKGSGAKQYIYFSISGTKYVAIANPVSDKNSFGLGWIIIYSSLKKLNQLQWEINVILLLILVVTSLIISVFSSHAARKISAPFSSLNQHLGRIAERNFGTKIHVPVDDELQEFVSNINTLSEKLELYDKAQKTFLQNASHEFRTPLMSIQSYAEGIKYGVVESSAAADIIIGETKRTTRLVEDLLYLSRLDSIEENYSFRALDLNLIVRDSAERMRGVAASDNISICLEGPEPGSEIMILADEEKLSRAFTNIISNCIRYADSAVKISCNRIQHGEAEISIRDDGPGIDNNDLPNIFERFYKGRKGNSGLGLAISRNIIEKHKGKIYAANTGSGAMFIVSLPLL